MPLWILVAIIVFLALSVIYALALSRAAGQADEDMGCKGGER